MNVIRETIGATYWFMGLNIILTLTAKEDPAKRRVSFVSIGHGRHHTNGKAARRLRPFVGSWISGSSCVSQLSAG